MPQSPEPSECEEDATAPTTNMPPSRSDSACAEPFPSAMLPPPPSAKLATTKSASTLSSSASLSPPSTALAKTPQSSESSTHAHAFPHRCASDDERRRRCDSTHRSGDGRLSIYSTSGTAYESAIVVGHIYGSDNVVYYLVEVRSGEMPLEGYVIRRRFNDFKQLHRELAAFMAPPVSRWLPSGSSHLSYSSLLCHPVKHTGGTTTATSPPAPWSPSRPRAQSTQRRRSSITDMYMHGIEAAESGSAQPPLHATEDDMRFSAPTFYSHNLPPIDAFGRPVLPFAAVAYDATGRPRLPPLPPSGLSAMFMTRETLIKLRIAQLNRILAAVLRDTSPRVAELLMNFIQDKPSAQAAYVSLNQYAALDMPWSVERLARRRAMSSGKKALKEQMANTAAAASS